MSVKLSSATLGRLSPHVAVPGYDRAGLKGGILHFGIGSIQRAVSHIVEE